MSSQQQQPQQGQQSQGQGQQQQGQSQQPQRTQFREGESTTKVQSVANPAEISQRREEMSEVVSSTTHISTEQTSAMQASLSATADREVTCPSRLLSMHSKYGPQLHMLSQIAANV